jgi:hypothetical protein
MTSWILSKASCTVSLAANLRGRNGIHGPIPNSAQLPVMAPPIGLSGVIVAGSTPWAAVSAQCLPEPRTFTLRLVGVKSAVRSRSV